MEIDYTTGMNFTFVLFSLILGGMHGFEPGHGKTVVAAYLIGTKGTKMDAIILGLIVTLTHTSTVIALAFIGKIISIKYNIANEILHKYMAITGGIVIFIVGLAMLIQRLQGKELFHNHTHYGHHHDIYDNHAHIPVKNKDQNTDQKRSGGQSYLRMMLLGISGGLVPCPAAITMLVYAGAKGKLGAGLTYILLFSTGLAITLITIALIVVGGGNVAKSIIKDSNRFTEKIAIGSASLITLIGLITIVESVISS